MNIVEIENVTKTFGRTAAVADLSLIVPKGSIYGFIGPNGSGKTTTLRMITGIFFPDRGSIRLFGDPAHGPCSDRIGYLPEERGLYKRMKVREILRFYGELKCGHKVNGEVEHWLKKLELMDAANKPVEALSKGMGQKVQFLTAVVFKPELLILDEPFSGLDPVNAELLKSAILELRSQGTTVILSTHDMSVAEKMCDFIFMIFQGHKVLDGTLASIQDRYGNDTVRVRTADGCAAVQNIPGVEATNDSGQLQELRLAANGDAQAVLKTIMDRTRVLSFEIAKPSLHDIFVRIVRSSGKEIGHG